MALLLRSKSPPSCGVVSSTTSEPPPPPVAVIVSVSVFSSVAILIPLPASMYNLSVGPSATMSFCPFDAIVENVF